MRPFSAASRLLFALSLTFAVRAFAQATVELEPTGPDDDDVVGGIVSPHGNHVATLVVRGSRYAVQIDGVLGPKIEALKPGLYGNVYAAGSRWEGPIPVLFSDDGSHNAYIAQIGAEWVVFEDGKELTRGPLLPNGGGITVYPLEFTHEGKHLIFMDVDQNGKFCYVVDGKPTVPSSIAQPLTASPDGEHYAFSGFTRSGLGNGVPEWTCVDGRQFNYVGENFQYTAKGVLISQLPANGVNNILINGKPSLRAYQFGTVWISPDGGHIATVVTPNPQSQSFLTLDGKTVAGTQGVQVVQVYFSDDGKRYAALCANNRENAHFMIIDGKKGEAYQTIQQSVGYLYQQHYLFGTAADPMTPVQGIRRSTPGFTADGSKFEYLAQQGGRVFLVVEDDESNGFQQSYIIEPTLSATGNRIGWVASAPNGTQHLIIDSKDMPRSNQQLSCLTFSPDGAHYAVIEGRMNLLLDGTPLPGLLTQGEKYVFSQDGSHIAYVATVNNHGGVLVDGKVVSPPQCFGATNVIFSPDGHHLLWIEQRGIPGTRDSHVVSIDGKIVTHYGDGVAPVFEFDNDDTLTFVARTDETLRRFHIKLGSGTLESLLATLRAAH